MNVAERTEVAYDFDIKTQMKVCLILQMSIEAVLLTVTDNIRDWDIKFYVIKSEDTYI